MTGDGFGETWFETAQAAKEDFVSNLIGNMTAEEVDGMEFTPDMIEHAKHFRRLNDLRQRADADSVHAEYIKAVADGEDAAVVSALEQEVDYYDAYGAAINKDAGVKDELDDNTEYDGRDDEFIKAMAGTIAEWEA